MMPPRFIVLNIVYPIIRQIKIIITILFKYRKNLYFLLNMVEYSDKIMNITHCIFFMKERKQEVSIMRNKKASNMVLCAILIAIILMLAFTPGLGYIPLGAIRITTVHIPVIIGAILLGPNYGAILGGVFGLTSFINNTVSPMITSFVFTPFYTLGDMKGNLWSLVICFLPRILIGITSYYAYVGMERLLKHLKGRRIISLTVAGIVGSLTNTILVMNLIYIFFGKQYAEATARAFETLYHAILIIIGTNGVLEAIAAALITAAVGNIVIRLKHSTAK